MAKKRKTARRKTKPAARPRRKPSAKRTLAIASDTKRPIKERVQAIRRAPLAASDAAGGLEDVLRVLGDAAQPASLRLAALQTMKSAAFSLPEFDDVRSDYIATLRSIVADPDPTLRQRVLGVLIREKDGFAQKKLIEGLKNPDKALVPPEKALQLLAYDPHGEIYTLARAMAANPPNDEARREALRVLAADATNAPEFEQILRDKAEVPEVRQIAAAALRALQPESLQATARDIVLDPDDNEEVQATSLTALAQARKASAGDDLGADTALVERATALSERGTASVKKSASRFLEAVKPPARRR